MTTPHYSPTFRSDPFVFVSGQLALDASRSLQGDTVAEQTRHAVANLAAALATHGLGLEDIVKTTVWITRREDFAAFNEAYAAAFGSHRPARSTVVCDLAIPGALIEIEAIAKIRQ